MDGIHEDLLGRARQALQSVQKFTGKVPSNLRPMAETLEEISSRQLAWFKSLSKEDQAKVDADNARPDAEKKEEFDHIWSLADESKDGLLQKDEMPNLFDLYVEKKARRDVPNEPLTDEQKEAWYDFFEAQSPDVDGVSVEDYEKGYKIFTEKFIAKMKEDQKEQVEE